MANFEVRIDEAGFRRVGVAPTFNENLYGELLDEFVPSAQELKLTLTPHVGWGRSPLGRIGMALTRRDDYEFAGVYSKNKLKVNCDKNEGKTNNTLLHETKHYIDDVTGEIEVGRAVMKRSMDWVLGTAAVAGVGIGVVLAVTNTGEPILGAVTGVPAVPLMYRAYWKAPHEVAARQFSFTPEITKAYGRVIRYHPALK